MAREVLAEEGEDGGVGVWVEPKQVAYLRVECFENKQGHSRDEFEWCLG